MAIIDGKALAKSIEIKLTAIAGELRKRDRSPTLVLLRVGDDSVTERFVRAKVALSERIGVSVVNRAFPRTMTTTELINEVGIHATTDTVDGIVVQLPLPPHIDTDEVLRAIPIDKDVDVLSPNAMGMFRLEKLAILPPVVAAVQAILESEHIDVAGMDALVIGKGRLVGNPVALWLKQNDAHVTQIEKGIRDISLFTREADLIVSGTGVSSLITPDIIKHGTILVDAGTSEQAGVLRGDIDSACAEHARLYTPVPGGIGPLTTVMLYKNLLVLSTQKQKPDILES